MAEEAVPVVLAGHRVPRPVRVLGVGEDDAHVRGISGRCRSRRSSRASARAGSRRASWNQGCWSDVWLMTRSAMIRMPRCVRRRGQGLEVLDDADGRVDLAEVGDVVPVVLQGRLVDRHQPEAVDPQVAQVVELLDQPAEVAVAVAARIVEAADIGFVDDGVFVPIRRVPFHLVPFHRAPPSREDSPDSPLRSVVSTVSEGLISSRGRRGDVIKREADPGCMRTSRPAPAWPRGGEPARDHESVGGGVRARTRGCSGDRDAGMTTRRATRAREGVRSGVGSGVRGGQYRASIAGGSRPGRDSRDIRKASGCRCWRPPGRSARTSSSRREVVRTTTGIARRKASFLIWVRTWQPSMPGEVEVEQDQVGLQVLGGVGSCRRIR